MHKIETRMLKTTEKLLVQSKGAVKGSHRNDLCVSVVCKQFLNLPLALWHEQV